MHSVAQRPSNAPAVPPATRSCLPSPATLHPTASPGAQALATLFWSSEGSVHKPQGDERGSGQAVYCTCACRSRASSRRVGMLAARHPSTSCSHAAGCVAAAVLMTLRGRTEAAGTHLFERRAAELAPPHPTSSCIAPLPSFIHLKPACPDTQPYPQCPPAALDTWQSRPAHQSTPAAPRRSPGSPVQVRKGKYKLAYTSGGWQAMAALISTAAAAHGPVLARCTLQAAQAARGPRAVSHGLQTGRPAPP